MLYVVCILGFIMYMYIHHPVFSTYYIHNTYNFQKFLKFLDFSKNSTK